MQDNFLEFVLPVVFVAVLTCILCKNIENEQRVYLSRQAAF